MLNPVKLHDSLWSISVASMLNWSSAGTVRYAPNGRDLFTGNTHNNSHNNNNNNNHNNNNNSSSGGCFDGESEGMQRLAESEDLSSSPNFDSSPLNHFPFPTNFLSRGLPEESCASIKEKLIKQAAGKSFTIDSLLGITNAAQVAIQNCILPGHPCHIDHHSTEGKWLQEKVRFESSKDNRFSPYHSSSSRKERSQISSGGGSSSSQNGKADFEFSRLFKDIRFDCSLVGNILCILTNLKTVLLFE
jgi:hypothetical protein